MAWVGKFSWSVHHLMSVSAFVLRREHKRPKVWTQNYAAAYAMRAALYKLQLHWFTPRHASVIGVFLAACGLKTQFPDLNRLVLCRIKAATMKEARACVPIPHPLCVPTLFAVVCLPFTNSCSGRGGAIAVHLRHQVHASDHKYCFYQMQEKRQL